MEKLKKFKIPLISVLLILFIVIVISTANVGAPDKSDHKTHDVLAKTKSRSITTSAPSPAASRKPSPTNKIPSQTASVTSTIKYIGPSINVNNLASYPFRIICNSNYPYNVEACSSPYIEHYLCQSEGSSKICILKKS